MRTCIMVLVTCVICSCMCTCLDEALYAKLHRGRDQITEGEIGSWDVIHGAAGEGDFNSCADVKYIPANQHLHPCQVFLLLPLALQNVSHAW